MNIYGNAGAEWVGAARLLGVCPPGVVPPSAPLVRCDVCDMPVGDRLTGLYDEDSGDPPRFFFCEACVSIAARYRQRANPAQVRRVNGAEGLVDGGVPPFYVFAFCLVVAVAVLALSTHPEFARLFLNNWIWP